MSSLWPALDLSAWSATCDTLHAHTQILGKLAVALAPPEPQLQHAALRLTARGWETAPLPAPDGSGTLVVTLDLRQHAAVVEHSDGRAQRWQPAARDSLPSSRQLRPEFDEHKRDNGRPPLLLAQADVATCTARREDRMMLWLLATLSGVSISWGIAHRLKAVNPAANCTGERCSCRLDDRT